MARRLPDAAGPARPARGGAEPLPRRSQAESRAMCMQAHAAFAMGYERHNSQSNDFELATLSRDNESYSRLE
jgi:hypothetical protein